MSSARIYAGTLYGENVWTEHKSDVNDPVEYIRADTLHQSAPDENRKALEDFDGLVEVDLELSKDGSYFLFGRGATDISKHTVETIRRALLRGVPAGWKLVPMHINEKMILAGFKVIKKTLREPINPPAHHQFTFDTVIEIYDALLEAAPEPETTA